MTVHICAMIKCAQCTTFDFTSYSLISVMLLNKSLQSISSYFDFYLSLFEWAETLCKQGLHRASHLAEYFYCYTFHAVACTCDVVSLAKPVTLCPIDPCPIAHSAPATAGVCYHSQLPSDTSIPSIQLPRLPALAQSPCWLLSVSPGSSLRALPCRAALFLHPPLPLGSPDSHCWYPHPAAGISRAQVWTFPH